MGAELFTRFFQGRARDFLLRAVRAALAEDGADLTANAVFPAEAGMRAAIVAKEWAVPAGLPIIPMILEETARLEAGDWSAHLLVEDGHELAAGTEVCRLEGSARVLLRAERVILNFLTHLSGVSGLTRQYVKALEGTGVCLLDTRKTLPGLRFPEKYAVLAGGGRNHRLDLSEMLMLKDTHIDAAGSINAAVARLAGAYAPMPPLEIECRTPAEADEAARCNPTRIMLDNMDPAAEAEALDRIPAHIEVEISGGVTLENIGRRARPASRRKPDFISVGRLSHSAPAADFSMRTRLENPA